MNNELQARLIIKELGAKASRRKARLLARFFKTGKGEYGEGDVFIGVMVPQQRAVAKKYFKESKISDLSALLRSKVHEHRLTALIMLMMKYKKGNAEEKEKLYQLYIKNLRYVNNWDLVDVTCRDVIGQHLFSGDRKLLDAMAHSNNIWQRRVAIISTAYFIGRNQFEDTLRIAKILLNDKHDLIHKAVGWMLREIGKRDLPMLTHFLDEYAALMPRTMLRYAIEKLPAGSRRRYLSFRNH